MLPLRHLIDNGRHVRDKIKHFAVLRKGENGRRYIDLKLSCHIIYRERK